MYRELAKRPETEPARKGIERVVVRRPFWLFFLRGDVVEIDHDARQIRCHSECWGFAEIDFARVNVGEALAEVCVVPHGKVDVPLARGRKEAASAAMNAINLALAEQYESVRDMPDGLATAMKALDRGLPLSRFSLLSEKEQCRRVEDLLSTLPVTKLEPVPPVQGSLYVNAMARGLPITFFYRLPKDRVELAVNVKSPHGHITLLRCRELSEVGNGWIVVDGIGGDQPICVNGETNRASFQTLSSSLRARIGHDMNRLRVRMLEINPEGVRVMSRDGLRDLRDPRARLAGLLDLAVTIGEELEP